MASEFQVTIHGLLKGQPRAIRGAPAPSHVEALNEALAIVAGIFNGFSQDRWDRLTKIEIAELAKQDIYTLIA